MIRPIVKWSYIKGPKGLGRAKAHINYIQYREGADREKGPRTFFNAGEQPVSGSFIKQRLDELGQRGVQIHKIVLSPGITGVDLENYTKEMMENFERSKGIDLEWYAVRHGNTAHPHTHVVVMGTDVDGRSVQISLPDNHRLREWGGKYLEREHKLERYLDNEIEQLLETHRSTPELEYIRQRGDKEFERLMHGDSKDKKRKQGSEQGNFVSDRDLFNQFLPEQSKSGQNHRAISYKQYQTESAGRLSDFHERFQTRQMKEYWSAIEENFPELAADARRELTWIESLSKQQTGIVSEFDFDKLLDGLDQVDRDLRSFAAPEAEHIRQTTRLADIDREGLELTSLELAVVFEEQVRTLSRDMSGRTDERFNRLYNREDDTGERDKDERSR